ncbi:cytochrome d oxidase cyd, subunit II [Cryptobacterium curtum DSM 15641]|uniref:Cytochrome d oxidase cyd, subunit II n=1 Tax=Cryptobacterium curtum (strain ATCC 700683 / DSM 15641 / CCUG 43107 / 12-3) TaxID=469378 RepID=C7MPJ6_CRYCD|nr:cytochrome d ubiquinol oxidase subunit II [Cryptobacterium curtum]ACU94836.1 cytochrome d oxidase cyd, subunit II [Cryptobacterium curtum DSM 15641]
MTFLQILWFILIFVLIAGYFVLDGFDLGVGSLYPVLAKNNKERAVLRRAVGPVWDGNEVWLLTAGGALFAAFAPAYATTFSGFYLAIMLVLFGLILRAVSLEMHAHDPEYAEVWDKVFFVGSILPALLFGVAVGNVLEGIQLNTHGDYIGGFFALLNPFALVFGLLGLAQCMLQGASWTAVKALPGELHDRAVVFRGWLQRIVAVLFVLASVLYFVLVAPTDQSTIPFVVRAVFAFVVVAGLVASFLFGKKEEEGDLPSFLAVSCVCLGLVGLAATGLFPNIVAASDPALSISVAAAASSEYSLAAMTIITCIGLPLVLMYHVVVYRTFAGKIRDEDLGEY